MPHNIAYAAYFENTLIAVSAKRKVVKEYMHNRYMTDDDFWITEISQSKKDLWLYDEYIMIASKTNNLYMTAIEVEIATREYRRYIDSLVEAKYALKTLNKMTSGNRHITKTVSIINEFIEKESFIMDYFKVSDIHTCSIYTYMEQVKLFKEEYHYDKIFSGYP